MEVKYPERKTVTIVENQWWDHLQETVKEARDYCDRCLRIIEGTRDGDNDDLLTAQELVETHLRTIRRYLELLEVPL